MLVMLIDLPHYPSLPSCLCEMQLLDGDAAAVWFVGDYFKSTWSPMSAWARGRSH